MVLEYLNLYNIIFRLTQMDSDNAMTEKRDKTAACSVPLTNYPNRI